METLKNKLKNGVTAVGTHVTLTDSQITELVGNLGFDYIWIDTEHSVLSLEQTQLHLIAARAAGVSAIVRIPWNDPVRAKPVLEMGPDGIVFPQVNSYEEALAAVKSCMYPPKGIRGYGPRRAVDYGNMPLDKYLESVDENLLKLIQIEHIDAARDLDKMLTIPEISAFIMGPCDFASSMGHIGEWHHPEVEKEIDTVFEKVHKAGKKIGISYGLCSKEELELWKKRGADMISIAAETDYILQGAKQTLGDLRSVFG